MIVLLMPFGHLKLHHMEMRLISFLNLHICLYAQKIPVLIFWIESKKTIKFQISFFY